MTTPTSAAMALCLCLAACANTPPPVRDARADLASQARLDHVAINVGNAEASARFYKAVFGFAELPNPFAGGGGVVWLDLGHGTALHIFGGRKSPIVNERERHFAVTVADIARVTDYLQSQGLPWQDFDGVVGQIQTRPDGVHQLFFRDPDGYWIEVNDALRTPKPR